jgi:hypothetical protein
VDNQLRRLQQLPRVTNSLVLPDALWQFKRSREQSLSDSILAEG